MYENSDAQSKQTYSFIPHPALQYENTNDKQLTGYLLLKSKQFLGVLFG